MEVVKHALQMSFSYCRCEVELETQRNFDLPPVPKRKPRTINSKGLFYCRSDFHSSTRQMLLER